ncbi:MAG: MBL fold metallo-hydrolase [Clostridia bacterium]
MLTICKQIGVIGTNCYVVVDQETKTCLIIDCAYDGKEIENYILQNNLIPLAFLLTHGHFDHCGGVENILKEFKLPVYCHIEDAEIARKAGSNRWGAPSCDCYVTNPISDQTSLKIGCFDIKILHTPGHTQGSVCYFIEDGMFSGDTLFAGDVGRTDLAGGSGIEQHKSMQKIKQIKQDYKLFPGHEESSTLSYEQTHNEYLLR